MPETRLLIGPRGGPGDGCAGLPPVLGISAKEFLRIQRIMLCLPTGQKNSESILCRAAFLASVSSKGH